MAPIDKINPFSPSTAASQSSRQTTLTGGGASAGRSYSSSNLFTGSTVGLNNAEGPVFTSAQAGKDKGISGNKLNLYA